MRPGARHYFGNRALSALRRTSVSKALGTLRLMADRLKPPRDDSHNGPQLATYARYNVLLEQGWLGSALKVELSLRTSSPKIRKMDKPGNIESLAEIGRAAAKEQVKTEHFPPAFDLR
jgi:hypothetical protein